MGIYSFRDTGGEPNTWQVKHFANIAGDELFLMEIMVELPELVDASTIYGKEREALKEAIGAICIDGLMPAFEHLKKIRASTTQTLPELNKKQMYEDFTITIWRSYKDLMQKAAKMMDPATGFIFQRDTKFEAGLAAWTPRRPIPQQAVAEYLRKQRIEWQNDLDKFRNYLEHKDETDPAVFDVQYQPKHAEKIFSSVWCSIGNILAMLVSMHLPSGTNLVEIPVAERDPRSPRRFRFDVRGIPPADRTEIR